MNTSTENSSFTSRPNYQKLLRSILVAGIYLSVSSAATGNDEQEMPYIQKFDFRTHSTSFLESINNNKPTIDFLDDKDNFGNERFFSSPIKPEQLNLKMQIRELLKIEPVEDGVTHPAENFLLHEFEVGNKFVEEAIENLYYESILKYPGLSADLLQVAGRVPVKLITEKLRLLPTHALFQDSVEVREAAVSTLELWGGNQAIDILKNRVKTENISWLRDYMQSVINDLE
ncbi:MAG: hypothetical protein AB1757_26920 [Acidobacteriota bacterium]